MSARAGKIGSRGARRAIRLKRVYEEPAAEDGMRVLIDRLWPRGLSRQEAGADLWLKDVAPSNGLRRWYGHDPRRWKRFEEKYREELAEKPEVLRTLDDLRRRSPLTLLYGAHDTAQNNAVVLRDVLDKGEF
ncbi:MAG: DUF488 domain-containing protein [Burkholderiales bacterium]